MTFDFPIMFVSFAVFIPIFIYDIVNRKKRQKLSHELEKKLFLSRMFFRIFLAFSIIALAGPKWGMSYVPFEYRRGLDIVFAVDISRSMDIKDAQTDRSISRLERGLSIARETILSVTGARYATAVGRGRGYLTVPLTYDNEANLIFLESLEGSLITGRSTNLESLLDAAVNAFQSTSAAQKIIILISDGESHFGVLRNAIARCIREGIIVNTVAVGSEEGRQIQAFENSQDSSSSEMVLSRREAAVMRNTAERTGGIYIDGGLEDASAVLSAHLLSLSHEVEFQQVMSETSRKEPKQRRTFFIVLALVFLGASKFITRLDIKFKFRAAKISLLLLVLIAFSSCTDGKILLLEANYLSSKGRLNEAISLYQKALNYEESSPYAEYGLGLAFYSLDEPESALGRYENSQRLLGIKNENEHRELRYRNHYNSGIIYFEEADYYSAAAAFREALKTDPKRIEAKRNLELSLISLSIEADKPVRTEEKMEPREILFEYLREDEQEKWKSREWTPEENFPGPDY